MTIQVRNAAAATFAANVSSNWGDTPTRGVLWVRKTNSGNFVAIDEAAISPALSGAPTSGDTVRVAARGMTFTLTGTNLNEAGLKEFMEAAIAGDLEAQISLHDGAPGSSYTGNEIASGSNAGYSRASVTLEFA